MIPIQKIKRYKLRGKLSHHKNFGSPLISPETLGRIAKYITDQGATNYCTAAARKASGSYLFGREMSFEYQVAKEGEVLGAPIYNGADPDSADKACSQYGFLPQEQSPLSFENDGWYKPAVWQNYDPKLDGQSIMNTAVAYNVYPDYQSIKEALVSGNSENAIVIANGFWFNEWQNPLGGIVLPPTTKPITRHDYIFIDYKTCEDGVERLIAQLSQGEYFGDGGLLYMSETTVNAAFANPGFNGIGCEILRRGVPNPQEVLVTKFQLLVILLGEIVSYLKGI